MNFIICGGIFLISLFLYSMTNNRVHWIIELGNEVNLLLLQPKYSNEIDNSGNEVNSLLLQYNSVNVFGNSGNEVNLLSLQSKQHNNLGNSGNEVN